MVLRSDGVISKRESMEPTDHVIGSEQSNRVESTEELEDCVRAMGAQINTAIR
jgi:hypothetical protein